MPEVLHESAPPRRRIVAASPNDPDAATRPNAGCRVGARAGGGTAFRGASVPPSRAPQQLARKPGRAPHHVRDRVPIVLVARAVAGEEALERRDPVRVGADRLEP